MNPNSNNNTEIAVVTDKSFDVALSATRKLVNFVKPTYGPSGNKILVSKILYTMIVDDGVTGAREFEVDSSEPNYKEENAVLRIIREVAGRTSDRAGDGTTSSIIMLGAIMEEIAKKKNIDTAKVAEELQKGCAEVREALKASARPIETKEDLKKVARISFDNEQVAEMIADLYIKLGKEAVVTVEKSQTMDITSKVSEGITFSRGYISPYMMNNDRGECELDNPLILLTDYRITEVSDIFPIMSKLAEADKRKLVIIAENVESHALSTLVVNKLQGKFESVAICTPQSSNRTVTLEDMAMLLGAKVFSMNKGDKLEKATIDDLGKCDRITVKRNETIIVGPKGDKVTIATAITSLRATLDAEKDEYQKKDLEKRLAMFTQSIAVIKVGAVTENEQKALKMKIENAVKSTQSAFRGGVVCGSGLALARVKTSSPLLNKALTYQAKQLRENVGLDDETFLLPDNQALNVVTGATGDFMEVGVADPVDVLITGVESAVSIASLLVTMKRMVVEDQKKPPIQ